MEILCFLLNHIYLIFSQILLLALFYCVSFLWYILLWLLWVFFINFFHFLLLIILLSFFFSSLEHYMQFYLNPQGVTADLQKKNLLVHILYSFLCYSSLCLWTFHDSHFTSLCCNKSFKPKLTHSNFSFDEPASKNGDMIKCWMQTCKPYCSDCFCLTLLASLF